MSYLKHLVPTFFLWMSDNLGAVFRTVLETMRTLFVWIVNLVLFYGFPYLVLGESWSKYSFLQAGGCVSCP